MLGLYLALIAFWAWACLALTGRPMRAFWLFWPMMLFMLIEELAGWAFRKIRDFSDWFDNEDY